jgi:hypothetical protein
MQQQQQLGQRPSSSNSAAECALYVRSMYRHTDVCERSCQIQAGRFPMFPLRFALVCVTLQFFSFRATGDNNNIAMGVLFRLPSRLFAGHCSVATRSYGAEYSLLSVSHTRPLTLSAPSIPLGPVSAAIRPISQSVPASTHTPPALIPSLSALMTLLQFNSQSRHASPLSLMTLWRSLVSSRQSDSETSLAKEGRDSLICKHEITSHCSRAGNRTFFFTAEGTKLRG